MKVCRQGVRVIATAFLVSLSNTFCFSGHAADLLPIVQGGGYYNWGGLYAGGNLGGGTGRTTFSVAAPGLFTTTSDEIRGFVGGGQAGYNWQFGPLVAGVEADAQFSHQQNGVNVFGVQFTNSLDWFSTLRGRVGYAMDEWLFYVTGGGGYAGTQASVSLAGWASTSDARPIWVVGLGVETQIWDRWTGRLEYLYFDGGSVSNSFAVPGGTLTLSNAVHDNVIRTGLNYHF